MSDIDTIREALKQAEKIIGKQPGLTSSALAALDRLQAQQPNAEPVAKAIAMVDDFRWAHEHAMELATATHGPMPEGYDDDDEPDTPWHCFYDGAMTMFNDMRAHPPASTEPRLTVEQAMEVVEPFIEAEVEMEDGARWNWESKHKKYREMIEEIRDRLTKAAKP